MGLLALEVESNTYSGNNFFHKKHNTRLSIIISQIKDNIKNPDLCLSTIAQRLGITERMIQYILADENLRFHQLLSSERCKFLASKIKSDLYTDINVVIFESGFESITTANRQFKKLYDLTPRQYQHQLREKIRGT
ncbi:helix-turn-helix transcriptional regulator [Salmonella enterica subsp. enterica]|nr:helix-turn-helix transcriptional regulator [Salmonella enterica subsp. enterica]